MKNKTTRNPVAKFSHQFNRDVTHIDRKKAAKQGKLKHKNKASQDVYQAA
jgi:hypothetical protein